MAGVGLNVRLTNIFEGQTKGEMMAACAHANLATLAATSYSCGKGKRINAQCGRCVPCLIRQAAFHSSGTPDGTHYRADLRTSAKNDDVMAARIATARARQSTPEQFGRWATKSDLCLPTRHGGEQSPAL
uniref:7-cyano-7-deazaguanine synthase n=1 Tax=Phenylobacterium glaciei TaxID=2803784 RepID=A0A974P5K1_9CAUL|nr:7-cyano-7-deazaguanine synthase [Phenylobacterium glaciei]